MQNRPKLTSVVLTLGVICCCSKTQLILTDPEAFLPENKLDLCELWNFGEKSLLESKLKRTGFLFMALRIPQGIHFPSAGLSTIDLWRLELSKNYGYVHSTSLLGIMMAAIEEISPMVHNVLIILYTLFPFPNNTKSK